MLLGIQLVGILFGLVMLYITFLHNKRKEFSSSELLFWVVLWIAFIYLTLFPYSLGFIVKTLNFTRAFDLLVVTGFLFVISLGIYNYFNSRNNKRKLEEIVRKVALKEK